MGRSAWSEKANSVCGNPDQTVSGRKDRAKAEAVPYQDGATRAGLLWSANGILEGGMTGCIIGWAHSKFGKHEGRDVESLIIEVTQAALADAGVAAADIDTIYLGTMNGGFVRQEFPASLVFQADPARRF